MPPSQLYSSTWLFGSPLHFNQKISLKPALLISAFSSAVRREKKRAFSFGRSNSTVSEPKGDRNSLMAEAEKVAFNKKRALGGDKSSKARNLQLKARKLNPINTICYVQILGTGMDTQDTSPSVFLFFDKQRFIFNAGEGLQRFCTEHKIKLSKIDHMFLTRVCSETAGGLPGLLLTLAGMGEEGMSVNIWGPSDLKYLIDAMTFIPNAAMVHTHRFGSANSSCDISSEDSSASPIVLVDDEVVKVSAILLRPGFSKILRNKTQDSQLLNLKDASMEEVASQFPAPLAPCFLNSEKRVNLMLKPGDISVIYACELPEIKGKFDPAKAVALGLKPGPKYRELQLGISVTSDHQNIMVHPSDVLGPSIPGPIVLLVDCPTVSHLQEMLLVQSLNDYYVDCGNSSQAVKSVNCVIHLGPATVTMTADYQKWMKRFGGTQHVMAGHGVGNMEIPILKSSARIASRLNCLCPQLFPVPGFLSVQHINNWVREPGAVQEGQVFPNIVHAENLLKFHLRPYSQLGLDKSGIPSLLTYSDVITELHSEIPDMDDISRDIGRLWRSSEDFDDTEPHKNNAAMVEEPWINAATCTDLSNEENVCYRGTNTSYSNNGSDIPCCLDNISREDMEIVLLGTGSSQPSKYRNVSSIYINLFSKGSILLDCGEGTLAQLKRRFGINGADDAIRKFRCIWISHIHADHHTGLARILSVRSQLLKGVPHEPLIVVGPRQLKRFLDAYSRVEDIDMQFLDCRDTTEASWEALAAHSGTGNVAHQVVEKSLFTKSSKMEKLWKRAPDGIGSLVDFPVLKRLKQVLLEGGLETLTSFPVVHCPQAFGVALKALERTNRIGKNIPGWKVVYSGDTRPCPAMIDASRDATVLIHEATFEDGMLEEAVAKNHSTTKEAIDIGESAGAYRIILTHFSQRYPKIPVINDTHMQKTCIAFDMMSVNMADLPVLPKIFPHLKLLFKNELVPDESEDADVDPIEQLH